MTPYERLKKYGVLSDHQQAKLDTLRKQTNPLILRKLIDEQIHQLLLLPTLDNTETVNVFQTLITKEVNPSVTLSFDLTGIRILLALMMGKGKSVYIEKKPRFYKLKRKLSRSGL